MFFCMPHSAEFWLSIGSLVSADLPVGHYLVSVSLISSGEGKISVFCCIACVFWFIIYFFSKTWLVLLLLTAERLKSQEIEILSKAALLIKEHWVLSEH